MRIIAALCLFLALPALAIGGSASRPAGLVLVASEQLSQADREAVQEIIRQQLEAFRADDAATAFGFASPGIQGMFGSSDNFMNMVRQSYPQVYRSREAEFRDVVDLNGRPTQRVLLVGPDGKPVIALYPMERQPDGSWRIDGCMLGKSDDMTA